MRQALFFTFEMSLAGWERAGILGRELSLYRELSRRAGVRTDLVTYGGAEDLKYLGEPGPEFEVLPLFEKGPRNKWLRFFLSWLAPFRCREILRHADWVKTNQMWGAWAHHCGLRQYKESCTADDGLLHREGDPCLSFLLNLSSFPP